MFTNEYTSAVEGGEGGGDGEEGGEGECVYCDEDAWKVDVDSGFSETNVMFVVSLASSYKWITAGSRFSSCCCRSRSMSFVTL